MSTAVTAVNADGSYTTRSTIGTLDVPVGAELAGDGVNDLVTRSFEQSFTATGAANPAGVHADQRRVDDAGAASERPCPRRRRVDGQRRVSGRARRGRCGVDVGRARSAATASVIPVTYQCLLTALDASTYTMEVSYTQVFSSPSDAGVIEATVAGIGHHRRLGVQPVGRLGHPASDDRRDPGCRSRCTATRRSPSPGPAGSVVTTDSPAVLVERDGDIVTITLDRPEKRNALAVDVMDAMTEALRAAGDTDALGIVIAARGPVFSAGHNFGDMAGATFEEAQTGLRHCAPR